MNNLFEEVSVMNSYEPSRGIKNEVAGVFSAMRSMKTDSANSTVSPSVTFSPESGLIQNPSRARLDSIMEGMMTLYI